MNRPGQRRRRWLMVMATGLACLAVAGLIPWEPAAPAVVLGVAGINAAILGLIAALAAQGDLRHQRRLLNGGERIVARWQVDPLTWQQFVEAERGLTLPEHRTNVLSIPRQAPQASIEVIVGETAVQVGEDFLSLRARGMPAVQYAGLRLEPVRMVELGLYMPPVNKSPAREFAMRFPMGTGADADKASADVVYHYHTLEQRRHVPPLALRNPALTRKISLTLLALSVVTAGVGFYLRPRGGDEELAVGLAVGGIVAAIGVLVFMLAVAWMPRR